jgi:colicin import membrane protein
MKENVRVSVRLSRAFSGNGEVSLFYPMAVSFVCHVVFLAIFVLTPNLRSESPSTPSVINVSMVSFKNPASKAKSSPAAEKKAPEVPKTAKVKPKSVPTPSKKPAKAVAKPKPKPKTSLKKKTFKSTEVVKHAIKQLEPKAKTNVEKEQATSPEMLKSALERLRQEVKKTESAKSTPSDKAGEGTSSGTGGKIGKFNENGKKTAELIDLYRLEVAFQIQKNWAFNEQLAGGDQTLAAAIVFKVMPDGEIRDIFFTDRSGNAYLDESAYKAIVKSNPVDRHPEGLKQAYVVMAIRFTPQGIR